MIKPADRAKTQQDAIKKLLEMLDKVDEKEPVENKEKDENKCTTIATTTADLSEERITQLKRTKRTDEALARLESLTIDDLKLIGYEFHPKIEMLLATY